MSNDQSRQNLDFFKNFANNKNQLQIKVEIGVLNIPRDGQNFYGLYTDQIASNSFFPTAGGPKNNSFVNANVNKLTKSNGLTPIISGLQNSFLIPDGAPYCTFLSGTINADQAHPFYDLLVGPPDAPQVAFTSTEQFVPNSPQNVVQEFQPLPQEKKYNFVSSPFIPPSTKTYPDVADIAKPCYTYNLWRVNNITPDNFNFVQYKGFAPKPTVEVSKTQPYAEVNYTNSVCSIQAYASNSQIELERIYPINADFVNQAAAKYFYYEKNGLISKDLNLAPEAVGFCLQFRTIQYVEDFPFANQKYDYLEYPQILIEWGGQPTKDSNKVTNYKLKMNLNQAPVIYFNSTIAETKNAKVNANQNSVALDQLDKLTKGNYDLYVYYCGPYLLIGNSPSPSEMINVAPPELIPKNSQTNDRSETREMIFSLPSEPKIKIFGQKINFAYTYGPPLFDPIDFNNNENFTSTDNLANSSNFVTATIPVPDNVSLNELSTKIYDQIQANVVTTLPDTPLSTGNHGGASFYVDKRFDFKKNFTKNNINIIKIKEKEAKIKITFPPTLAGLAFNKYLPDVKLENPSIKEDYCFYNISFTGQEQTVAEFLSNKVTKLTIDKKVDPSKNAKIESDLNIDFVNLNTSDYGLKILQFIRQNVTVIRVSAGYSNNLNVFFEGMIESVKVVESLDKTVVNISAKDLLTKLFDDNKTMILSKYYMKFPGMFFVDVINTLVNYTELKNHFEYDLGSITDRTSIAYKFFSKKQSDYFNFPPLYDTQLLPGLAAPTVKVYDSDNSYFKVLEIIKSLCLVTDNRFDIPIYYWYSSGSRKVTKPKSNYDIIREEALNLVGGIGGLGGVILVGGDKPQSDSINGIVMSSRTLDKDQDLFFIQSEITEEATTDLKELHCRLRSSDAFTSSSNSGNLFQRGIYRYIDGKGQYHNQDQININAFNFPDNIENLESYVGYEKLVFFDNPPGEFNETQLKSNLFPKGPWAKDWIKRYFRAAFTDVYEQISLSVYVTQPLKEWGSFRVQISQADPKSKMPDLYLYQSVNYVFDIDKNLITASIEASRKPIQTL